MAQEGVHDQRDLPAYRDYVNALQRDARTAWLIRDFGYGTRHEGHHMGPGSEGTPTLLEILENPDATVVDLGCGPGNSTKVLLETLPAKMVIGVDPSQDFLTAAKTSEALASYVASGRVDFRKATAETLTEVVESGTVDMALASVVWLYFTNRRQALTEMRQALRPGGRFIFNISSTHYDFQLPQAPDDHGPVTYEGTIGKYFIGELEKEIEAQWGIPRVQCSPKVSQQYNNLSIVLGLAAGAGLALVKYEEKNWPYEKEVLEGKLRTEPRRIMMADPRIAGKIASGEISADQVQSVVEAALQRTLTSDMYQQHEGRFNERWACFVLQKPYR